MIARGRELGLAARARRRAGADRATSATASSGCCASSRSSRSAPAPDGRGSTLDEIEELTAPSAERKAWSLADALVAGDAAPATAAVPDAARPGRARCRACSTGWRSGVRTAHEVALALEAGEPAAQIKRQACGCPRAPPIA